MDGFADGTHPDVWGTVNDALDNGGGGFVGRTPRDNRRYSGEFNSEGRPHTRGSR